MHKATHLASKKVFKNTTPKITFNSKYLWWISVILQVAEKAGTK